MHAASIYVSCRWCWVKQATDSTAQVLLACWIRSYGSCAQTWPWLVNWLQKAFDLIGASDRGRGPACKVCLTWNRCFLAITCDQHLVTNSAHVIWYVLTRTNWNCFKGSHGSHLCSRGGDGSSAVQKSKSDTKVSNYITQKLLQRISHCPNNRCPCMYWSKKASNLFAHL